MARAGSNSARARRGGGRCDWRARGEGSSKPVADCAPFRCLRPSAARTVDSLLPPRSAHDSRRIAVAESRAALHSALAEPVSVEAGWSAVTLMRDTLAFNVRIWMPKLGWGDQMSAT